MYTLYKQGIIFIIILDRVPPSLNKLYYYYYYHCLPTPTSRVCTGRRSLIWEIHFTSKGGGGTPVLLLEERIFKLHFTLYLLWRIIAKFRDKTKKALSPDKILALI